MVASTLAVSVLVFVVMGRSALSRSASRPGPRHDDCFHWVGTLIHRLPVRSFPRISDRLLIAKRFSRPGVAHGISGHVFLVSVGEVWGPVSPLAWSIPLVLLRGSRWRPVVPSVLVDSIVIGRRSQVRHVVEVFRPLIFRNFVIVLVCVSLGVVSIICTWLRRQVVFECVNLFVVFALILFRFCDEFVEVLPLHIFEGLRQKF